MLFDWSLSRLAFLGQVVDLDLRLCTGFDSEHADLFLCLIFTQRPIYSETNVIKRLSEAMSAVFVGKMFSLIEASLHWKLHFTWKKKTIVSDTSRTKIYRPLKLLTLEVSIARVVALFRQASRSRPAAAANSVPPTQKRLVFVLAHPNSPSCKSSTIDFAVKAFDHLLEKPSGVIARWPTGARTWTQTWTKLPDQRAVNV